MNQLLTQKHTKRHARCGRNCNVMQNVLPPITARLSDLEKGQRFMLNNREFQIYQKTEDGITVRLAGSCYSTKNFAVYGPKCQMKVEVINERAIHH